MSKEKDYLDKIEVHRQEVELDEISRRRTRTRSSRKQNNAPKSPMIKILVVIFILIPLGLLGYVWLFYEPEVEKATQTDNSIVHIEKNNTPAASPSDEEDDEDQGDNNGEGQDSSDSNQNDIEVNEEEEQKIAKAAAEAEKKLKAEQQADEEANGQSSNAKTHVVSAKDTLFSIAMKYYKDPTKVDAIKKANNLSSDSIPLGKELILP